MRFIEDFTAFRGLTIVGLVCLCGVILPAPHALARESIQPLLQRLATEGELQIAGARVYDLPISQELYSLNAYAPIWTREASVRELSTAIEQAFHEGMNPHDYHQHQVQGLRDGTLNLDVTSRDLLLTDSLVRLAYHYARGKVDPKDYVSSWNFERELPQTDPTAWLSRVARNGDIKAGLAQLKPTSATYENLVSALGRYREIAANGGWDSVDAGPALRKGDTGLRVTQLRRRLRVEGDLDAKNGAQSDGFDADLELAAIRFQRRHRLDTDGIVGRETLAAMNVNVTQRIDQLRVNLERARILQDIPPTAVVVDIAGFEVSLFRDGHRLLRSRAQVGSPYRSTPVFRDTISYIEFNPTWTVPPSILVEDVLPAIKQDPDYLSSRNMQVLTFDGAVVDPSGVDWQAYPQRGFPYMIRQQPGPDNALGRVKIMFPNEHLVYLHDTPSRELFKRSERTFSSGCIRVEQIERLLELLLDDPREWNRDAIDETIATRQTRRVSLINPVPIYLVYWTVQVDENGEVHFKRDPYDRDAAFLQALEQSLIPDPARLMEFPNSMVRLNNYATTGLEQANTGNRND